MTSDKPLVIIRRKKKSSKKKQQEKNTEYKILNNLEEMKKYIQEEFFQTSDLKMEDMKVAKTEGLLVYLESTIDMGKLQSIFSNKETVQEGFDLNSKEGLLEYGDLMFGGSNFELLKTFDEAVTSMLNGDVVIAVKNNPYIISIGIPNSQYRSVSEPTSQTVIRGPKDSFVESIATNKSLIRRRIRNKNLRFESFVIGSETQTLVNIGYIHGIANGKIVEEVRRRLKNIDVAAIFESGNVEELISDKSITVFPLAINTERPDTVAGHLIEGKICIIVNETPFVLIVPAVYTDFFNSAEDYYNHYAISSFLRIVRYIAFMIVLIVPSAYVGILTFHHELIPTYLLINIIAQREGVPFPAVVEVLIMEFTFEILREAGIRMPRAIGQTVSIVGALVIGQAAAEAGIISNIMVIIVAITATANFVSPYYSLSSATRVLRFALIPIAAVLGLYGVLLGLIIMVAHLASLRSFGIPYLAPVAPLSWKDQKDIFIRAPYWALDRRPSYLKTEELYKQKDDSSPTPPKMRGGKRNE